MEKFTSGVPGLDNLLGGGIYNHSSLLATGAPGTGKTILGLQFLLEGAKKNEPGVFMTPEIPLENIRLIANSLGLEMETYEKKGLIYFVGEGIKDGKSPLKVPFDLIRKKKIKRLVLDSITFFHYLFPGEKEFRRNLLSFIKEIKDNKIAFLATSERPTLDIDNFRFQAQDFLFDGLILLTKIRKGASFERTINVAKMRGQNHDDNIFPVSIGRGGMKVQLKQLPFSLIEKSEK